ncbi:MAG: D-alanyl-D-alanine carboxypeptidase [Oscillospiraceae bacterium]|nr:D-alanyl-D-alanine carboxypeptidase [Oscillospiraceae bacterium]
MKKAAIKRIVCIFLAAALMTLHTSAEEKKPVLCEVLIEASGGAVIHDINGDLPVPVGTMAKLMTVLLAAEQVDEGKLKLDEKLKTSSYANSMQGAQIWLMPGEEITAEELFKGVIIGNANDAAAVLAEAVGGTEEKFVELMNSRAAELNMKNTVFTNSNGYYDDSAQISTAHDLALLCAELAKHDFLRGYFTCWRDFVRDGETELVNANELVKSYEGIAGFKAGYSESAGHCIASGAERDGVMYIAVVLGCEDKYDSFSEAKKLMSTGFSQYKVFTPELPKDAPAEIAVRGGMAKTVPLEYGDVKRVVLPSGAADSVSSRVVITDYVYAPVKKGYKAGEVQFLRNGKMMFAVDIVAAEDAEEINAPKALGIIFKKLLSF